MKFLFLIRHAKSSWEDVTIKDFDRPLNARGIADTDKMAKRLLAKAGNIDAFFSSPARRAKTTAEKFVTIFGKNKDQIIFDPELYLAAESFFDQFISNIDDGINAAAIFSHNPGITNFANTLTPVIKTDNIPTCGIFAVTAPTDSWKNFPTVEKDFLFYDYPKLIS